MAIDFHWGSFFDIADPCSIKDSGHIHLTTCIVFYDFSLPISFFFLDHGGAIHTAKFKILWFDHYTQMLFLD